MCDHHLVLVGSFESLDRYSIDLKGSLVETCPKKAWFSQTVCAPAPEAKILPKRFGLLIERESAILPSLLGHPGPLLGSLMAI